jgi:hypothetical protein
MSHPLIQSIRVVIKIIMIVDTAVPIEDISFKLSQKIRLKILDKRDITTITIRVLNFNLERNVLVITILKNTSEKKLPNVTTPKKILLITVRSLCK